MKEIDLTTLEALSLWHRVTGTAMRSLEFDFSTRQLAILFTVYLDPGPHTVKSLSAGLSISKAAICRAVDTLSLAELVKRRKDEKDKRNVFIQRTIKGSVTLSDFADIIMREVRRSRGSVLAVRLDRTASN